VRNVRNTRYIMNRHVAPIEDKKCQKGRDLRKARKVRKTRKATKIGMREM
jgi:hypothetical protein